MQHDLFLRYINNVIFWNVPDFMFLNYTFMISIFWREPMANDLEFVTDDIDIYFGSEYYFPSPS
jgi:hypothetical protein